MFAVDMYEAGVGNESCDSRLRVSLLGDLRVGSEQRTVRLKDEMDI